MAASRTVQEPTELLKFLFAQWPEAKKNTVKNWLKSKAVHVNGVATSQFNHPLQVGDQVSISEPQKTSALPAGMKLVFEDDSLIVIEKPEGLLSMASESERQATAYALLNQYVRDQNVLIVHRLDRETSGLMVFAKTKQAQESLEKNWGTTDKHYYAVVEGAPTKQEGTLHSHLDESSAFKVVSAHPSPRTREAITHYRVLKRSGKFSLIELRLETGRRHQIRVQLSDLGCPCVGDEKYGAKGNPARRLGLHSCRLSFSHPITGAKMVFESPLPAPLAKLVGGFVVSH